MITHTFEDKQGPLEYLWDLVRSRNILITNISLAQLADDFLLHIRTGEHIPLEEAVHWMYIASQLLYLKAKLVIGHSNFLDDDETSVTSHLKFLIALKAAEKKFFSLWSDTPQIFVSDKVYVPHIKWNPPQNFDLQLRDAFVQVLLRKKNQKKIPKAVLERLISLEEVINDIELLLRTNRSSVSLWDHRPPRTKEEVVVFFLALLELHRKGKISIFSSHTGQFIISSR